MTSTNTPGYHYAPKQNKGTMRSTLLQTITAVAVAVVMAATTLLLAPAEATTTQEEDAASAARMGEEMKRNFHQRFIPHRPDKPVSKERETNSNHLLYYLIYVICYCPFLA